VIYLFTFEIIKLNIKIQAIYFPTNSRAYLIAWTCGKNEKNNSIIVRYHSGGSMKYFAHSPAFPMPDPTT
jgi:hypothetical protein